VCDHDDGYAAVVEGLENAHHLDARARVKIARGFIRQEHARLIDKSAGDGHALLLAARELIGVVVGAVGQSDHVQSGQRHVALSAARNRRTGI